MAVHDGLNKRGFARPYVLSEHTLVYKGHSPRPELVSVAMLMAVRVPRFTRLWACQGAPVRQLRPECCA